MDKPHMQIEVRLESNMYVKFRCLVGTIAEVPIEDAIKHKEWIAGYIANEMRKFILSLTEDEIIADPVFEQLEKLHERMEKICLD